MSRISLVLVFSAVFVPTVTFASVAAPLESVEETSACNEDTCDAETELQRVSMLQVNSQVSRAARTRLQPGVLEVGPDSLLQEGGGSVAEARSEASSLKAQANSQVSREATKRIFSGSLLAPSSEQALASLKRRTAKQRAQKLVDNRIMLPKSLESARASRVKSERPQAASVNQAEATATILASVDSTVQPAASKGTRVASQKATNSIFAGSLLSPSAELADQVLKRQTVKTRTQKAMKNGYVLPSSLEKARQAKK